MSKITITKGNFLKTTALEVEYLKSDGTDAPPAECSEHHISPPHTDLKKAFESLSTHAAIICEDLAPTSLSAGKSFFADTFKKFAVTGFTVVGKDADKGVIITARKTLKWGKTMGFNTPKILLISEAEGAYEFAEDLTSCVEDCKDQLIEYLGGKFSPNPQRRFIPG